MIHPIYEDTNLYTRKLHSLGRATCSHFLLQLHKKKDLLVAHNWCILEYLNSLRSRSPESYHLQHDSVERTGYVVQVLKPFLLFLPQSFRGQVKTTPVRTCRDAKSFSGSSSSSGWPRIQVLCTMALFLSELLFLHLELTVLKKGNGQAKKI